MTPDDRRGSFHDLDILMRATFPEAGAGGYSRHDGSVAFFSRVRALAQPSWRVLDFGAGRAAWMEDPVAARRDLCLLRGHVARVVGVDVDPVVLENRSLDEAHVIEPGAALDFEDRTFDLIICDKVFEHLPDPVATASEFARVLRPGGWVCGRTPHKLGYIGLAARIVPNRLHASALRRLQPWRQSEDVFPTTYQVNSHRALREVFHRQHWDHFSHGHYPEALYVGTRSPRLIRIATSAQRVWVPPMLMVFLRRR